MKKLYVGITLVAVAVAGLAIVAPRASQGQPQTVMVYKTPFCGCCSAWMEHLEAAGFKVMTHEVDQAGLTSAASEAGVPDNLRSCHTAKVGGYTIEGHVPAADIERLLAERPAVTGIAVPGMPMGSPGMEQGGQRQPFDVIAFGQDGSRSVFATYK